jgi:glucose/arabinose dehydrogenase
MVTSLLLAALTAAQQPVEDDYYRIVDVPYPEGVSLEASGLLARAGDQLLVATRRGEVWRVEGATGEAPSFHLFAQGLQEPLGLLEHDGWIWYAERGALSRMRDTDGDGRADEFEAFCDDWELSGNYHEYAFGPRLDPEGNLWVTLNKPFGAEPFGRAKWRGWAVRVTPEGEMQPVCGGLRSPAGIETSPWGEMFATDNQGEWCGANKLTHLEVGDFLGHPHGIDDARLPGSRVEHPGEVPDGETMPAVAARMPNFKLPAVWFPYGKMGQSASGLVWDTTGGAFGPFDGQLFVADQFGANVMRVTLERVGGRWQGACYPFREGFACGIVRLAWAADGSLFAGQTNRGWGSKGTRSEGLQRLQWTGATPFEIHEMRALPDGFELRLTGPADPASVASAAFTMSSYTYRLQSRYGSDETDPAEVPVVAAELSADGLTLRLRCEGLRAGYVHELHADGLRAADGRPLLHPQAYYTLIERP